MPAWFGRKPPTVRSAGALPIQATPSLPTRESPPSTQAQTSATRPRPTTPANTTWTNLPPGSYSVEVTKTGFKKLLRPDVVLNVQDTLTIDFELAIGSVSDTVRVEAGAPLVN